MDTFFNSNTGFLTLSFWLYAIAYLSLIILISMVVWSTKTSKKNEWNETSLSSNLSNHIYTKYLLITTILCMAGLPPFHFFLVKVSLLTTILKSGNFLTFSLLMLLLLLSWYAYQAIVIKLLPPVFTASKLQSNRLQLWTTAAVTLILLFLITGLLFIEELYFLSLFFCL